MNAANWIMQLWILCPECRFNGQYVIEPTDLRRFVSLTEKPDTFGAKVRCYGCTNDLEVHIAELP